MPASDQNSPPKQWVGRLCGETNEECLSRSNVECSHNFRADGNDGCAAAGVVLSAGGRLRGAESGRGQSSGSEGRGWTAGKVHCRRQRCLGPGGTRDPVAVVCSSV